MALPEPDIVPSLGTPDVPPATKRKSDLLGAGLIALAALALYLPGLSWGLPSTVSWSQDTIAGARTLGAVDGWPDQWRGRYPPLHYLLLAGAYKPVLAHWERTGQRVSDPETGERALVPPHAPKIGLLLLIARWVSLLMAVATAAAIRATTMSLTGDRFAANAAAGALMVGATFSYFAGLGNVDIPSMCWFSWSVYFYVRATKTSSYVDCALLGLFGAAAISTKDSVAGIYPGMALMLWLLEARRRGGDAMSLTHVVRAAIQPRWLLGIACFAFPYLWINGAFHDFDAYHRRMTYWLDPPAGTLHARQHRYPSQWHLALATVRYAAGAVGWPMLLAMLASIAYALRFQRMVALLMLAPMISYYGIVIARIDFVYSRFLLPPLALACVLVGVAAASLLQWPRGPAWAKGAIMFAALAPSLTYAVAIKLEMRSDSRYAVEIWFQEHVEPAATVGAFSKPQYLPRLSSLGYATYAVTMARESFERPQPEYLILTSYNYEDFDDASQQCMEDLLSERLGYRLQVTVRGRYLGTGSSWLSVAGWGAPVPGKISPTLVVLRRVDSDAPP